MPISSWLIGENLAKPNLDVFNGLDWTNLDLDRNIKAQSRDNARSYSYNIRTSRSIKETSNEDLNESPLQLLPTQEAQARPGESTMRILNVGFRVLSNLLVPLIPSPAKILNLMIPGS
ncbi:hypothetical protein Bca4012_020388 [Brassica carinata]